jgi:hypothetical protein
MNDQKKPAPGQDDFKFLPSAAGLLFRSFYWRYGTDPDSPHPINNWSPGEELPQEFPASFRQIGTLSAMFMLRDMRDNRNNTGFNQEEFFLVFRGWLLN